MHVPPGGLPCHAAQIALASVTGKRSPVYYAPGQHPWKELHTRKARNQDEAGVLASEVLVEHGDSPADTLAPWDMLRSPLPPSQWLEAFDEGVAKGGTVDISPILTLLHTEITGKGRRGLKLSRDHIFMYKNKRKMDDELPWIIFDPHVVVALSGLINPISLSLMIAGCVLTQCSRRGIPGSWERSFVMPVECQNASWEWLQRIHDLFHTWNPQVNKYRDLKLQEMRARTGEACIPPRLFRRMMELTSLPGQTARDLRAVCRNFSWLISLGARLYYENTLVLEHLFGMVRMIAGGQQMPPAAALAALGKMKRQSLAFAVDDGQLEAAARMGLADRQPQPGGVRGRRSRRSAPVVLDSTLDGAFLKWRSEFLANCVGASTLSWLRDCILSVGTQAKRASTSTDDPRVQIARSLLLDTRRSDTGVDASGVDDIMLSLLWILHGGHSDLMQNATPDDWRPEAMAEQAKHSPWLFSKWKRAIAARLTDVDDVSLRSLLDDTVVTLSRETTLDLAQTIRAVKTPLRINANNNPSLSEGLNSDSNANNVVEILNKLPNIDHTVVREGRPAPGKHSTRTTIVDYLKSALKHTPEAE